MNVTELHWVNTSSIPILSLLQLLPLLVMGIILSVRNDKALFVLAIAGTVAELALSILLYSQFDNTSRDFQFAEQLQLIGPIQYHAAVDGVAILFMLLTSLLSLMAVLYSYLIPLERRKNFLALTFIIISSLMGQFTTLDMLWFVLTSIIHLLLVGYVLWSWATSPERDLALSRYMQFMSTGLLLLLLGVFMLGWNYSDIHGYWSFDIRDLLQTPIPVSIQSIVFFLLFYGLAIRIPLFPLHGWLPVCAEHGMVAIAPVFLLGLKTGIFGLIRFVLPLLPDAVIRWHEFVVAFAVIGIFYAALLALMQVNLRRLLAFAVVSHTSILILGLFSLNHEAFQGGVMLSVNFGIAITGLLFTAGFIFWRTQTLLLSKLGGLFDTLPLFGITFFIAGVSIIGMPGTPGYDSVHLVLEASIDRFGALLTVAAAVGNVIAAGFLLWAFQTAFLAPVQSNQPAHTGINPASLQERLLAFMIIGTLLGVGFYPQPWLDLIENSLEGLSLLYGHQG
ncbi:MAG: NADH-quinone oxidoreductase subunit M [Gammaproteobacteria bacterium]|nr:NADH-quinone oxidoreductase subunit M [Gammaproteobacteria bacterium]